MTSQLNTERGEEGHRDMLGMTQASHCQTVWLYITVPVAKHIFRDLVSLPLRLKLLLQKGTLDRKGHCT